MGLTNPVDVEEVLESITASTEKRPRVTEGLDSIWGKIHPLGVVALAIIVLGVLFSIVGTDLLIGNFAWWHWVGLAAIVAVSTQFAVLDAIRAAIEMLAEFAISGIGVSVVPGAIASLVTFIASAIGFTLAYDIEIGITAGFGFATLVGSILMGPVWVLTWSVFLLALYSSLSRYIARFVERDLIISQVSAMSWQVFALIGLVGIGYGVREGINPRIDFWWAEFSNKKKALLDFSLHVTLFIPFLIVALRIFQPYAKVSLGWKRNFNPTPENPIDGQWPSGWRVWETWEQQGDAGQLPTGPIQAMIFVAVCLFFLQIVADAIKHGFTLIDREDLGQVPEQDAPIRVE